MGFTVRKSLKIAPGVRMSFSKSGIGMSAGVKGYRVSKGADGRVRRTASIPGTGIRHTATSGGGRASSSSASRAPVAPPAPTPRKPGLMAPKGEKLLYKAVQTQDIDAIEGVGQDHPDFALASAALAGVMRLASGTEDALSRQLLAWVFDTGKDPATDPFISKYVSARFTLDVAKGAAVELGLDRSAIGLALAELHQDAGDVDAAVSVVEQLDPTTFAALSLAELYGELGRHTDVVGLTDGLSNEDDATALLLVFRGVALREQGYLEAAREAFKEALKSKKRVAVVRHRALLERARTYEVEGKRSMARKDLERIMAEDSTYEGLSAALSAIATDE